MALNMGYNPGFYSGGVGMNSQTVPYLPTYMQQPMQSQIQQNVNWIYVNGLQGARDHIVQPGSTAWLMDNNEPVIYVKAVDNVGSSTLRAFQLTEISQGSQEMTAQYVTKEEFNALSQRFEKLISDIGGMNS